MVDSNALKADKASNDSWTATLQRWSGESEDLALPIPLDVQIELGLTENSIITAAFVDGQLVISEIDTKISLRDIETPAKDC
jgi:hypothetical protein